MIKTNFILFHGMIDNYNKWGFIDLITLSDYLNEKDLLEKAGGTDYIISFIDDKEATK